jgi:hypothetical protein
MTTQSLLRCGVLAGPMYVLVSLAQAVTRDGFDLRRHAWSLLSNGSLGWLQITNFILAGLLVGACAIGLRRAGVTGAAPALVGVFAVCLIASGVFRADPALGFPPGTPAGPGPVSWHGLAHLGAGAVGFTCLAVASFLLGRRFAAQGARRWAAYSIGTGVLLLAGFGAVASSGGQVWANLAFTAAIVLVWAWLSSVCAHLSR